jgi:hypothetical protein
MELLPKVHITKKSYFIHIGIYTVGYSRDMGLLVIFREGLENRFFTKKVNMTLDKFRDYVAYFSLDNYKNFLK